MSLYLKIVSAWAGMILVTQLAYADLDDLKDLGINDSEENEEFDPSTIEPDLGSKPTPIPESTPKATPPSLTPTPTASRPETKPKNSMRTAPDGDKEDRKKPIKWSAKGLKASRDGKIVDLVENVIVTQGNLRMTANTARVFFDDNDEVNRVEAEGDVKVNKAAVDPKDRISARGNRAVFYNAQRKVILMGRAALWRGSDVVRGKQISYSLDSGWITVDNVEGVVQPGEENERN